MIAPAPRRRRCFSRCRPTSARCALSTLAPPASCSRKALFSLLPTVNAAPPPAGSSPGRSSLPCVGALSHLLGQHHPLGPSRSDPPCAERSRRPCCVIAAHHQP